MKKKTISALIIPAMVLSMSVMAIAGETETNATTAISPTDADPQAKADEINKLENEAAKTEDKIKSKAEHVDKIQQEAEKTHREKEQLEKEAALKEKEAAVARQEAAALKKEAQVTRDPEVAKKAKQLEKEARQIEKESDIYKKKLGVAEVKAKLAEEKLAVSQTAVEALKKELEVLQYAKAAKRGILYNILTSLGIILAGVAAFLFLKLIVWIVGFFIERKRKGVLVARELNLRIKTVNKTVYWLGTVIIGISVVYFILATFGVSVAPLLAGAGIVGLAFGFGGQYLIRDVINGFFIVLEGQYRIDDVVKIGEFGGLVEDMNLRITTLRDLEGRVIIIPNGEIKTVVNYTKEYAQALLDVRVAYKENVDSVIEVIKEVGKSMRIDDHYAFMILNDLEMLGVDDFSESAVVVRFRIKTLPIKQWEVAREFRRRLKKRFDELGIEMPFPHRTIYWGNEPTKVKKQ
ncbi:MAG: mechanosensitive ion channel domain-containing protein [Candidatus Omnitrophota bacterium]